MKIQICLLLAAAASGAGSAPALHMALATNLVSPSPSTTEEGIPSSSTTGTPIVRISDFTSYSKVQAEVPHISVQDVANTSSLATGTPKTNDDADKSLTAAESDVSLQIVFSILGILLALASVVVAIFFGCRQPRGTRGHPAVALHEIPHGTPSSSSSSDVDLETGPTAAASNHAPPGVQSPVADRIFTHTLLSTRYTHFFDKPKAVWAATWHSLTREGQQPSASPPSQNLAPIHQVPAAPIENSHEQQGGATRSTATPRV